MSHDDLATDRRAAYRAHLERRLIESQVPWGLRAGLIEYIAARRPTGHFLRAVLSNDLREACARGDPVSCAHLSELVFFLFNYAPAHCWGSADHVDRWLTATEDPPEVFE